MKIVIFHQYDTHATYLFIYEQEMGMITAKQACKPQCYASSKLQPTDRVSDLMVFSVEQLARC